MCTNSCVIIDPIFILYVGFENAACRFVEMHWTYFLVAGSQLYEGTYSRWKDMGKGTEFLVSLWATGR